MTPSEAGKLGAAKSRITSARIKAENKQKYLLNPKHCLQCNVLIPYDLRLRKFCSSSCSTTYNNLRRVGNVRWECLCCKQEHFSRPHRIKQYCNATCFTKFQYEQRIRDWKINGIVSRIEGTVGYIKRYILEKQEYKCAGCGLSDWRGKQIVLELEHKDGNSENNTEENLECLCPNCHSQTLTYKNKNLGNGRTSRRKNRKVVTNA